MNRMNQILAGLLVVQLGLAVLVFLGDDDAGIGELRPVVADFEASEVDEIQVFDRVGDEDEDEGADSEKKEDEKKEAKKEKPAVVLKRRGSEWALASHYEYPVETSRVTGLLEKVAGMRSRGPVASGEARQKQLDVADDDYQRKLVLKAGDKETVIYVGSSAGARQTSVRLAGRDEVHGVTGLTPYGVGAEVSSWIDTTYFKIERDDIASIEVSNDNGSFTLERTDDDKWQVMVNGQPLTPPRGSAIDTDAIDRLAGKLAAIYMAEPGDPARDLSDPLATVTIRTRAEEPADGGDTASGQADAGASGDQATSSLPPATGQEYIIDLASTDAADRTYVRVRGNSNAALVNALSIADVVELSRDRLIREQKEDKKGEQSKDAQVGDPPAPPASLQP